MCANIGQKIAESWRLPWETKVVRLRRRNLSTLELLRGPTLPILEDGFLGLELPNGTNLDRAREIADFLDRNVA